MKTKTAKDLLPKTLLIKYGWLDIVRDAGDRNGSDTSTIDSVENPNRLGGDFIAVYKLVGVRKRTKKKRSWRGG